MSRLPSVGLTVALLIAAATAYGAQRQFVASTGADINPCTLPQPCRSFGVAVAAVDAGGEVVVLDSAGYGPVTITKSVSILSPAGIYSGISVPSGQDGIAVSGAGVRVKLEGLTINGTGGNYGIRMLSGTEIIISKCSIRNMLQDGINITGPAFAWVYESKSTDNSGNGFSIINGAVTIDSSNFENNALSGVVVSNGSTGIVKNSTATANALFGILVFATTGASSGGYVESSALMGNLQGGAESGTNGTGVAVIDVVRSTVSKNQFGVSAVSGGGTGTAYATSTGNVVNDNNQSGIIANGIGAFVIATSNTISRNLGAGLIGALGGTVYTLTDNTVGFNSPNSSGNVLAVGKL